MDLRRTARDAARRLGVEITRSPAPNTLPWQLRQIIRLRQVDGVIDVGGHWGEFAALARRVFPGPIVSFEPHAESFDRMADTMGGDPLWTGSRIAIGRERGTLELNVFPSTDLNSFRSPNELFDDRFEIAAPDRTEEVPVRRLDDVVELTGELILKSDTQGFDIDVVRGATGILDRVTAIVIEVSVRNIYDDTPGMSAQFDELSSLGYELVGLFPLLRDRDRLRVIEFDGVFVRV